MSLVRSPISGIVRGAVSGIVMSADDGPSLDLNYALRGALIGSETFTRSSSATDLLYTASSGTYNTFASNAARVSSSGLLIEESRTQSLGVTDTPATQTVTLGTGTYTLWMIGSGSVTPAAGTAVGTGFAAATQGTPKSFTISTAGTVIFTVSGTVTRFQCEKGAFATSYIPNSGTAGTTVTRAADVCTVAASAFGFTQGVGTIIAEVTTGSGAVLATGGLMLFALSDGTASNRIDVALANSGSPCLTVTAGGATSENSAAISAAVAVNAAAKVGLAWSGSSRSGCVNGGTISAASGDTFPTTITRLDPGCRAGNQQFDGFIKRLRYWPRRLSDAELQALTA